MYNVVLYEDARGYCPVEDLIKNLDESASNSKPDKIALKQLKFYIGILQEVGTRCGEPYTKHIEDDIWELRPGKNRVLFSVAGGNTFVLLHWFKKETNKTPRREIEKAKDEIKDWLHNHGH